MLRRFGFTEFTANLSTKDPQKYVGDDAMWDKATADLRAALERYGLEYGVKEGDAAFYGPKIDIDVRDAIGRKWQLSTIQLDFNQPERFKLEYVAPDGSRRRPYMLHRALFGSVERFFGVLLEHYAGAFPVWMAPVQVKVLPVANAHSDYAHSVVSTLRNRGFRAEIVDSDEQLGKRIRTAKVDKVPYVLVVGDDDVAGGTVGVNPRGGDVERGVPVDAFADRMAAGPPWPGSFQAGEKRRGPEWEAVQECMADGDQMPMRRMRSPSASLEVRFSNACQRAGAQMENLVRVPTSTQSLRTPACASRSAVTPKRPCLSKLNDSVCEKNRAKASCASRSVSAFSATFAWSFSTSAGGSTAM